MLLCPPVYRMCYHFHRNETQSSVTTFVFYFPHTQSATQRTARIAELNDIFRWKYLQVASQCADALSDRRQK